MAVCAAVIVCIKIWAEEEGVEKDLDSGREVAGASVVVAEHKTKTPPWIRRYFVYAFDKIGRAHV